FEELRRAVKHAAKFAFTEHVSASSHQLIDGRQSILNSGARTPCDEKILCVRPSLVMTRRVDSETAGRNFPTETEAVTILIYRLAISASAVEDRLFWTA